MSQVRKSCGSVFSCFLIFAAALFCAISSSAALSESAALGAKSSWTQWTELENINYGGYEDRYGLAAGTLGGKIYAIGGTNGFKSLSLVRYFDPIAGYWREGPPMPTPRSHLAVAVSGAMLYAIGGSGEDRASAMATVEALDPKTSKWSLKAPLPTPRYGLSVAVIDGLIYAVGGRNADGVVNAVEAYDPSRNVWIKKAALPNPVETRNSLAAMDGVLYLLGGNTGGACLGKVQAYNPKTDKWAIESRIPGPDCYLSVAVASDAVYAFGAIRRKGAETSAAAWIFSPKTGRWELNKYDRPFIEDFALGQLRGKFYFMGGKEGGSTRTPFRIFDSGALPAPEIASIPHSGQKKIPSPRIIASDVDGFKGRTPPNSDDFALIIGIEKYRGVMEADYAEKDAAVFGEYAQSVLGIPKENIILLLNQHASQTDLAKYLEEWLPRNVNNNSRVFFYYSGHGAPDPEGGNSYLVPWDGDPAYLKTKAYSLARLYRNLGALRAKEVIVLLDACFSGAGPRSLIAKGLRPLVSVVHTQVPRGSKLAVLTAASGSEVAGTLAEQGHGLFTYFMLKGLMGHADAGHDGHVELEDLYQYVNGKVSVAARRQNREQTPQMFTSNPQMKLY